MSNAPENEVTPRLAAFLAARKVEAYVVGGQVRDRMLGRRNIGDVDVAVKADADALGRELADQWGGTLVPLSPAWGRVRLVLHTSGEYVAGDGHRARHIDISSYDFDIQRDLAERDFTINAMAVPISAWDDYGIAGNVVDPFGGRRDLLAKTIRATGSGVFASDPLRMMRAIRLSGELGMRLEPDTVRLILAEPERLDSVSRDRVRDELLKILAPDGARSRIEALDKLGLLCRVIPELMATKGVDQPKAHYWDVWGHSLHTLQSAEGVTGGHQNSPVFSCVPWTPESERYFAQVVSDGHTRRTLLKLAALLHDIAKPQTKTLEPDGRTRFFGHQEQGAEIATQRLAELRLSNRGIDLVSQMVLHHMRPASMSERGEWPTARAVFRYFRDASDVAIDTLYLAMADYLGAKGPDLSHPEWVEHAKMLTHTLDTGTRPPVAVSKARLVSGHDLMYRLNLPPGPRVGRLLGVIEEAQAAGEIETLEQALELAKLTLHSVDRPCGSAPGATH